MKRFLITGIISSIAAALTALRMTVLSGGKAYIGNALMNPSPLFLAFVLLIFTAFNLCFVGGFFRTGYKLGKPFVLYIIAAFLVIGAAEALHHFPGLGALNAFGFEHIGLQLALLLGGALLYAAITYLAYRKACADFEKIDL